MARRQLARNRRTANRSVPELVAQRGGQPRIEHIRQDLQLAVDALQPLRHHHDDLPRARQPAQDFRRPMHAARVDAEQHDVGIGHCILRLAIEIGSHTIGDLPSQFWMQARFFAGTDDVVVQVGADQSYIMTVIRKRVRQCRTHNARAENCDACHDCYPSHRGQDFTNVQTRHIFTGV
jgi:hypothetical protein